MIQKHGTDSELGQLLATREEESISRACTWEWADYEGDEGEDELDLYGISLVNETALTTFERGYKVAMQAAGRPVQGIETERGTCYFIGSEEDVRDLLPSMLTMADAA